MQKEEQGRFSGNNICMIPTVNKAAAVRGGRLYVYDLKTLDEYLLMEAGKGFGFGHPTGRCLSYNCGTQKRSDVYILRTELHKYFFRNMTIAV